MDELSQIYIVLEPEPLFCLFCGKDTKEPMVAVRVIEPWCDPDQRFKLCRDCARKLAHELLVA